MPSEDEQLVPPDAPAFFEVETDPATGLVTKSGAERVQGGQFRCGINTTTTSPFLHGFFMDVSYVKVGRAGRLLAARSCSSRAASWAAMATVPTMATMATPLATP